MIVVGKISVKAILENKKRTIHKVYLLDEKDDKEMHYVLRLAKGHNIIRLNREALNEITQTTMHGGYAVECDNRISDPLNPKIDTYFCIEGVSDPYNLGEILRSLYALGIKGVITPHYDFFEHEAKLIRASAGASEHIHWILSKDLKKDLTKFNKHKLIAAHRQDTSESLIEFTWPKQSIVCIGGALRGLSRSVLDLCDTFVRLDYDAKVALSANSATTVFAYSHFQSKEQTK